MPQSAVTTTKSSIFSGRCLSVVLEATSDTVDIFINGEVTASVTLLDGKPTPVKRPGITSIEAQSKTTNATVTLSVMET